ncbi:MAG: glycosyltransferase family 4 protein [Anaerolineae bacterium]|nr:glycosyltransferase family 4 protein [Anaerolineae bacterium]
MVPRNLLFVSTYTGLGGGESAILNLLGALDPERYRRRLLTPGDGVYPRAARALGVTTHTLPYRGASAYFVPALWARFPIVRAMARLIKDNDIDLAHTDYHSLPFVLPAAEAAGVPVMWTCMGWWFRPRRWQRAFFRRIACITAISHAVKDGFLGAPPVLPPERVAVHWLGTDPERFHPGMADTLGAALRAELGVPPDAPVVSMLARFQHVKGYETFFAAARLIAAARPDARFILGGENMAGTAADRQYRQRMLQLVENDARLKRAVVFAGYREHAGQVIAASDVMVCASLFEVVRHGAHREHGLRATGCQHQCGGPAETVVDGETGYLVPPQRPDLIAEKVLYLLDRPDLRARMGRQGRARVCEHFTIAGYARRFAEQVEALLA